MEALGYKYAYVYDSPAFLADAWMTLARAAERTSKIRIGVSVITPRLRHLVANAGAVATLCALAPGRVDVVVGTGFTSQLMLGKGPAKWSEVEEYVVGLRRLLRGEDIEWEGATIGLRYGSLCGVKIPQEPEIRVGAHGPKGYAVAERVADGVVTNLGHHSANTGADDMSKWLILCYGTVLEAGEALDSERVIDATGSAATFQLHIGREGLVGDTPEWARFEEQIAQVPAEKRHLETHRGHLIEVTELERPLVTAKLIKQTTGTGTRDEVRRNLDAIEAQGVQGVLYGPMGHDIPRELTAFAETAGIVATRPRPAEGRHGISRPAPASGVARRRLVGHERPGHGPPPRRHRPHPTGRRPSSMTARPRARVTSSRFPGCAPRSPGLRSRACRSRATAATRRPTSRRSCPTRAARG